MNTTKYVECAGGIVINNKKEVVVVNQNHDSWSLPKGHIDEGENKLTAAKREIFEESGIKKLEFIKPLGYYSRYRIGLDGNDDKSELKKIFIFLFKSSQSILKPIDSNNPIAKWIRYKNVSDLLTHPKDKEFYLSTLNLWVDI